MKEDKFAENILIAIKQANDNDRLVTLGIKPTRPDTGYGYIEFEEENVRIIISLTSCYVIPYFSYSFPFIRSDSTWG